MIENNLKLCLTKLPKDERDFSHAVVFGTMPISDIPTEDFDVCEPFEILNQEQKDFCPGYTVTEIAEDQAEIALSPDYQMAKIKQLLGDFTGYGADLRTAMQSRTKYGSLDLTLLPFDPKVQTRDFLANWNNYPISLDMEALKFQARSFFAVDGPHDIFDNIRVALWKNKTTKQAIAVGCVWYDEWTNASAGIIPKVYSSQLGGHAFKVFGQKTINGEVYLKIQNSFGRMYGEQGIFYIPRDVVNKEFAGYGQYIFNEMSADDAAWHHQNQINVAQNWLLKILIAFKNLLISLSTNQN